LVDPDTGISQNPEWKHVGPEELKRLYCCIGVGDTLVLYQHSQRRPRWQELTRKQFAEAIGTNVADITMYKSDLASDVVLFDVTRN
jgi:hypothetical protein